MDSISDLLFPTDYNHDALHFLDHDPLLPIFDHDFFMSLELDDEPQPVSSVCDLLSSTASPQQAYNLLLMCAEAIELDNWQLASTFISKLEQLHLINQLDSHDTSGPFLRLAEFFTQALKTRAATGPHAIDAAATGPKEGNMSAYQMVQELTPFVKFAHFTANQAILEATEGDAEVHVIDFDVVEGIQWPPLMVDLASRTTTATALRITALVSSSNTEQASSRIHQTGRRLVEFAGSIGFSLKFDQLDMNDLDKLTLQVQKGSVIANCTVQNPQTTTVAQFLTKVNKLVPKMVVLLEEEVFYNKFNKSSFVEFFSDALQHFASVSDSLACSFSGRYRAGLRLVEREMVGPRIVELVSGFPFGELSMEGFRVVPVSGCNVAQAKYLLGVFNRGFGVQFESGRLSLCWKSRPLINVSIWVPS